DNLAWEQGGSDLGDVLHRAIGTPQILGAPPHQLVGMKVILSGDFGDGGRLFLQKLDHVALELTAESATRLIPITSLGQHRFPPIFDGNLFSLFCGDAQDGTDRAVTNDLTNSGSFCIRRSALKARRFISSLLWTSRPE